MAINLFHPIDFGSSLFFCSFCLPFVTATPYIIPIHQHSTLTVEGLGGQELTPPHEREENIQPYGSVVTIRISWFLKALSLLVTLCENRDRSYALSRIVSVACSHWVWHIENYTLSTSIHATDTTRPNQYSPHRIVINLSSLFTLNACFVPCCYYTIPKQRISIRIYVGKRILAPFFVLYYIFLDARLFTERAFLPHIL